MEGGSTRKRGFMNSVQEIEKAIGNLSPQEIEELRQWFDQYNRSQPIDDQLKADLDAGRIDERIRRAIVDHALGDTR